MSGGAETKNQTDVVWFLGITAVRL